MRLPEGWRAPPRSRKCASGPLLPLSWVLGVAQDVPTQGRRADGAQTPDALFPPSIPNVEDNPAPAQ
jgi:hypothetical protein